MNNPGVVFDPSTDGTATFSVSRVAIPEGEVMLAPLSQLEFTLSALNKDLLDDGRRVLELAAAIDKNLRDAGAVMLREREKWDSKNIDAALVASALVLLGHEDRDDEESRGLKAKAHGIFTNPLSRLRLHQVEQDRSATEAKLTPMLISVARQAQAPTVPAADSRMADVGKLERDLGGLSASIEERKRSRDQIAEQIARRKEVVAQSGFDLLLDAGSLAKYGLQPVPSQLIAKPGETAYLVSPATLTKKRTRTHYEGTSSGLSIPVFRGVRYRVGTFKGRPISEEYLTYVGSGDLVLTNQRIAYIAAEHGVSIPLDKLLHVEAYTDGLAFLKEGREAAYAFLVGEPNRFLFYLNYVLEHRPIKATPSSRATKGDATEP